MAAEFLTTDDIELALSAASRLTVGVLGDLFLDRYLDLDAALTEPSLETGLDAYQVTAVRPYPGAAGTIINNLVALGVGTVCPVAVIGDDGEGYELRRCLESLGAVDLAGVFTWPGRRTPTYTKPMLSQAGRAPRELNRLDIHNRAALPPGAEARVLEVLDRLWPRLDGLIVLDQVSLPDTGVVTAGVRAELGRRGAAGGPFVLADSRERIGLFVGVCLKPNAREVAGASGMTDLEAGARGLAARAGRAVFCTRGEGGIVLAEPGGAVTAIPGYPVSGPTDPVGAGDSTSAGIALGAAAGLGLAGAAALGNLVASITVQQLGTTGTASPAQVRARWAEVAADV